MNKSGMTHSFFQEFKINTFSFERQPFVRAIGGIVGCVWVYMQKVELRHWWEYGDEMTDSQNTFATWKEMTRRIQTSRQTL